MVIKGDKEEWEVWKQDFGENVDKKARKSERNDR